MACGGSSSSSSSRNNDVRAFHLIVAYIRYNMRRLGHLCSQRYARALDSRQLPRNARARHEHLQFWIRTPHPRTRKSSSSRVFPNIITSFIRTRNTNGRAKNSPEIIHALPNFRDSRAHCLKIIRQAAKTGTEMGWSLEKKIPALVVCEIKHKRSELEALPRSEQWHESSIKSSKGARASTYIFIKYEARCKENNNEKKLWGRDRDGSRRRRHSHSHGRSFINFSLDTLYKMRASGEKNRSRQILSANRTAEAMVTKPLKGKRLEIGPRMQSNLHKSCHREKKSSIRNRRRTDIKIQKPSSSFILLSNRYEMKKEKNISANILIEVYSEEAARLLPNFIETPAHTRARARAIHKRFCNRQSVCLVHLVPSFDGPTLPLCCFSSDSVASYQFGAGEEDKNCTRSCSERSRPHTKTRARSEAPTRGPELDSVDRESPAAVASGGDRRGTHSRTSSHITTYT
ncbi:unnamed protein product [Trichogramma brassicae]|uniref:Uncharacterized protein n=1 Tax=Trichogramma brassicae TaxID=86971 RepID=A0A6H5IVR1_9HYME|nr:unnamed protein product [Trichogramma brassicae]